MPNVTTVAAVAAVVVLAVLALSLWRSLRQAEQLIRQLSQRIGMLERERSSRPSPRLRFEFNASTREALLHITNDGGDAEVWAPLSIEGALAHQLTEDVCAAWTHGGSAHARLGRGQSATLKLAQLDLSVFPYAQWQIYGVGGGETFSVRAMHTSMIGGDPETHAPALFLQIALATKPEAGSPPPQCTIALQPFEAVRLRPV
jgi:hypothetical protein